MQGSRGHVGSSTDSGHRHLVSGLFGCNTLPRSSAVRRIHRVWNGITSVIIDMSAFYTVSQCNFSYNLQMRCIVETQGQPADEMLDARVKTHGFFYRSCQGSWTLKASLLLYLPNPKLIQHNEPQLLLPVWSEYYKQASPQPDNPLKRGFYSLDDILIMCIFNYIKHKQIFAKCLQFCYY